MTHKDTNWSDALLNAHFQSLNQAWSDRNSVMLLLSEIRELLGSEKYLDDPIAHQLRERIELFVTSAATRVDRQPMKPAGRKPDIQSGRKTG